MGEKKRKYALLGGLCGLAYLLSAGILPDYFQGIILGVGIVCFILALTPEKRTKKIRKWKRRGK